MKVIDLLNKIANGEEVPKRIKYINSIWEYDENTEDYIRDDIWLIYSMNSIGLTEREVEIIEDAPKEEKKIPEKIPSICACSDFNKNEEKLAKNINILKNKYNEIIDYLKSKGDE